MFSFSQATCLITYIKMYILLLYIECIPNLISRAIESVARLTGPHEKNMQYAVYRGMLYHGRRGQVLILVLILVTHAYIYEPSPVSAITFPQGHMHSEQPLLSEGRMEQVKPLAMRGLDDTLYMMRVKKKKERKNKGAKVAPNTSIMTGYPGGVGIREKEAIQEPLAEHDAASGIHPGRYICPSLAKTFGCPTYYVSLSS